MTTSTQGDLFQAPGEDGSPTPVTGPSTGLFAEVVFDRPLDHAFSYAVGETLVDAVAVGKRVRAPFGKGDRPTIGYCVGLTTQAPSRSVKELLGVLDDQALLDDKLLRLTRWMADYYICAWGQVLNGVVPSGARDQAGMKNVHLLEAVPESELPVPPPPLTQRQSAALGVLRAAGEPMEPKQVGKLAECGSGPLESLVLKGFARKVTRRVENLHESHDGTPSEAPPADLNDDQRRAFEAMQPALREGGFQAFLLHGVTGSGKTEVYLRAIQEVLAQGKEALVLVPEISLTPQTIARFRGRCGEVAVLHSHLGDAERGGHWRRVASGQVNVVVGARSAVFAPTRKLGLIVIDEEHETTFKQETVPRYHARDVAVMRARLENIPILLGSATPSLESYHNAQRGQYRLLSLPNRVASRTLPQVTLIDRRHGEPPRGGRFPALSDSLETAMRQALKADGQVILLLNRRGFSTHIHCPACGHVETCRFCDLSMTYHKYRDMLLCHVCGYEQAPPQRCGQCGGAAVRYQGLGTEKLQEEVESRFPQHVVRRMDSDTMKKPGSHARVLNAFRNKLIHILLGTQMIAKGLDFPNVTLVGVVNADVGLHMPDFRAAERTFQLLSQVSGRAGRGSAGGRVLVQTFTPEHPCIALAATHDYAGFVTQEMAHRQMHNYPPFQRLARVILRSRDQTQAGEFAELMAGAFNQTLAALAERQPHDLRLLGPAEAPVFRLKGYYRFHFQMQSASAALLHQVLRAVLPTMRPPSGVEFTLDIDPYSMM